MNKLEAFKIFIRVAELQSFSKAAETLGLPKASISTYVQQLESSLNTRLLHRTTRRVELTQDGSVFFERCKDLIADVEEVESLFQVDTTQVRGRLRLDMPTGVAKNLVIPKLSDFLKEHPALEIELSSTDRKVDLIREGFDCVIRVGLQADSGLIMRNLGQLTLVNCASKKYLERKGVPKKIEDLIAHDAIHYVSTLGAKPEGFEYFDGEKYRNQKMNGQITVNNSEAYLASCLAGHGVIQVPLVAVRDLLQKGTLVEILPKFRAEPMPVSLVYPHRRNLARRVQLLITWLEKIMREYVS